MRSAVDGRHCQQDGTHGGDHAKTPRVSAIGEQHVMQADDGERDTADENTRKQYDGSPIIMPADAEDDSIARGTDEMNADQPNTSATARFTETITITNPFKIPSKAFPLNAFSIADTWTVRRVVLTHEPSTPPPMVHAHQSRAGQEARRMQAMPTYPAFAVIAFILPSILRTMRFQDNAERMDTAVHCMDQPNQADICGHIWLLCLRIPACEPVFQYRFAESSA